MSGTYHNIIQTGTEGGAIESIVPGVNISVDNTDPANPIVSSLSDRYKTTSTTSQSIVSTGSLTFTVGANLAYTTQQDVIIAFDASNHMHGTVTSYSGTTLIVDIQHKTGSGTYSAWTINLDAIEATPVTVTDSSTINLTITSQDITAEVIADSIGTTQLSAGVNTSLGKADTAVQPAGLTNYFLKTVDDTDDIIVGATNKFATTAEKTKLGFISVTQAVDLDTIETNANNVPAIKTKTDFVTVTQAVNLDTMESDIATKQPLDAGLTSLSALTGAGYVKATATDTFSQVTTIPNTDITGLGTLSTQSGTFSGTHSGTSSGTNTGDQTTIVGITGTKAQFDTAVTDGNFMYVGDAPTAHIHTLANITDVTMTVANLNSLDDGVNTTLHFHDADRARANHTGTQLSTTVSDFTEASQDAIGAMVDTTLVYTDATPSIGRAALTGAITASAGSNATALGSFTTAQLNTALSDNDIATGGGTSTGTNTGDNAVNTLYSGLATSKQDTITLTTTGTSGSATLVGATLNIPQYSGGGGSPTLEDTGITVDGGGVVLTTGSKGYKRVPFTGTITGWTIISNISGSIVMDVKKSTYAGFPTTATITGTEKPTLSGSSKNQDLTLSTWTTSVTEGDVLEYSIESVSTITRVTLSIHITPN